MASFLSWVDYSSAERQRMRQAVALFSEKETVDELGVGTVRDALSNAMFPGTSVIQTRLRYVLFIPWIYRQLERDRRAHAGNVGGKARHKQIELIQPLVDAEDSEGVIGRRARATLQRLPSSVYWLALNYWGIFEQSWSIDDYHRSWDRMRSRAHAERSADDHGVALDGITTWNWHLPPPPDGFPDEATFELTHREAEFIQERIRDRCAGSLLAHAVDAEGSTRPHLDGPTAWDSFTGGLPPARASELTLARKFAVLSQGAAFVYNQVLAQRSEAHAEAAERHAVALTDWAERAAEDGIAQWSLDDLWGFCFSQQANVPKRTRDFITQWQELYRQHGTKIGASPDAAQLVEQREWQLKGARSRFRNPRALEVWGGNSGTGLMGYRWTTVRQLLTDLYAGLDRAGAA